MAPMEDIDLSLPVGEEKGLFCLELVHTYVAGGPLGECRQGSGLTWTHCLLSLIHTHTLRSRRQNNLKLAWRGYGSDCVVIHAQTQ